MVVVSREVGPAGLVSVVVVAWGTETGIGEVPGTSKVLVRTLVLRHRVVSVQEISTVTVITVVTGVGSGQGDVR